MAHDVFISYSSKDKNKADAVCAKLEAEKIRCWIAPRDVPPGDSWAGSIVDAINESKVFVLVFTDGSNKSKQVVREVGEAVDKGIPIVPLRVEDVEPSREMRYYIKSIHWLDAMTPPLEQHLLKLTHSVKALLAVEDGEIPENVFFPALEAPVEKRPHLLGWATVLISLAAVVLIGGAIWLFTRSGTATSSMTAVDTANPLETAPSAEINPTEDVAGEPTEVSITLEDESDWRTLEFNLPNPNLWEIREENSYTAVGPSDLDAFAWSKELVEGDVAVRLDLQRPESQSDGCIIIYGGGIEFSNGNLIFCVDWNGFGLEKHTKYHEGENLLVFSPHDNESDEVYSILIEISGDVATMVVNGKMVLSTFFDTEEIVKWGRIGLWKNWSIGDVIYSNLEIKTLDAEEIETTAPGVEAFNCELDTGAQAEYYPVKSSFISHTIEIDGEITSQEEWSKAPCVDVRLHYGINVTNPNIQQTRWWVQNDEQNIYFLVRVPKEYSSRGVYVDYWWPEYTGTWEHSDGVYARINDEVQDLGQWDEMQWQFDTDLDPPGTVDIEAKSTEDDEFYWFELKRALSSGDSYDWVFELGQTYGANPYDSVMIGIESEEGTYLRYIQLEIGEP